MDNVKVTKDLENKSLTVEAVVNGPKEKVWRAYADQAWFEKWWGPEGWETTVKTFEFRPGGKLHYGMKCVDKNQGEWFGQESWGIMHIETVDEPNSFSVEDFFSDATGTINKDMPSQKFSVELVAEGDKTRLISRSVTQSAEQLEELIKMGMVEGFASQLKKLDALLAA